MDIFTQMFKRAQELLRANNTKESAAAKISAEFEATAYVSKGKLWASYKNAKGVQDAGVLA